MKGMGRATAQPSMMSPRPDMLNTTKTVHSYRLFRLVHWPISEFDGLPILPWSGFCGADRPPPSGPRLTTEARWGVGGRVTNPTEQAGGPLQWGGQSPISCNGK